MADFYQEMQGVASDLLREFKQGVIEYVTVTPGNGPADNPGPAQEIPTVINGVARGVKFKYIDGSNIVASDMQVTMPGNMMEPKPNGFIRIDGVSYKIVQIIRKPAAGTAVAFTVIFRK